MPGSKMTWIHNPYIFPQIFDQFIVTGSFEWPFSAALHQSRYHLYLQQSA